MLKYFLFDFDGTILNSNDIILKSLWEAVTKTVKRAPDMRKIYDVLGLILADQMKLLVPENPEVAMKYYKLFYRANMESMTNIFPEVFDTLVTLKENNIKCAIISNKSIGGINHGLNKFKLMSFFDSIISATDVTNTKPHPEAVYKALNQLGGKPNEALFIGDSPHDIECGKNAGIKTALVDWTIFPRNRFEKCRPDYTIKSFSELTNTSNFV